MCHGAWGNASSHGAREYYCHHSRVAAAGCVQVGASVSAQSPVQYLGTLLNPLALIRSRGQERRCEPLRPASNLEVSGSAATRSRMQLPEPGRDVDSHYYYYCHLLTCRPDSASRPQRPPTASHATRWNAWPIPGQRITDRAALSLDALRLVRNGHLRLDQFPAPTGSQKTLAGREPQLRILLYRREGDQCAPPSASKAAAPQIQWRLTASSERTRARQ